MSAYTTEEVNTIIKCVEESPNNLTVAFEVASNLLPNRTKCGITFYYYKKIKPNYTAVAVASPNKVCEGKNSIRRNIVPEANTVRDAMLYSAFNTLSKERAIKFLMEKLSTEAKIELLDRITTRINSEG